MAHPLRRINVMADQILLGRSPTFAPMDSRVGRLSIPPERNQENVLRNQENVPGVFSYAVRAQPCTGHGADA